jgi:hypothetical protein
VKPVVQNQEWDGFDEYEPKVIGYKDGVGLSYHDRALKKADKLPCKFLTMNAFI